MQAQVKVLCPTCHGKIAVDGDYYHELVGKAIDCPHCNKKMMVPGNTERSSHQKAPFDDLRTTRKIELVPVSLPQPPKPAHVDSTKCPHCGAEVGKRDRVCIRCESRLTPQA